LKKSISSSTSPLPQNRVLSLRLRKKNKLLSLSTKLLSLSTSAKWAILQGSSGVKDPDFRVQLCRILRILFIWIGFDVVYVSTGSVTGLSKLKNCGHAKKIDIA